MFESIYNASNKEHLNFKIFCKLPQPIKCQHKNNIKLMKKKVKKKNK